MSYLHLGMLDSELNEPWRDEQLYTIEGYIFRPLFKIDNLFKDNGFQEPILS